jgi:glycosyltransferase involved in cell wall biosynthesis
MMKIAYIYDAVYPWVKGGAEKRIYEIGKRMAKMGHEVHWFGLKWWKGEDSINKDGIYLHGIGEWKKMYVNGKRSIEEALYFGLKTLIELEGCFDIVDCQEFPYFSCLSSKIRSLINGFNLVITWYEVWKEYWFEYLGKGGLFGLLVERIVAKMPHFAICISDKVKEELMTLGFPEDKIRVIPNGVDYHDIEKVSPSNEDFDVIYVGRLAPHKNVDVLLRAISKARREIRDIRCAIIGDGPERNKLMNLAKKLGLEENVFFFGFLESDEEVYSFMKASKIFVLPSTREGFPNVILEANASGLPVILVKSSKNAALSAIKDGYNGFIVSLSDEEISRKIVELLQDPSYINKLSKNAREYAKSYDWSLIIRMLEEVYKRVVGEVKA